MLGHHNDANLLILQVGSSILLRNCICIEDADAFSLLKLLYYFPLIPLFLTICTGFYYLETSWTD